MIRFQQKHASGKRICNALQTNGVPLDDEFCELLAAEDFLVGLSIDGPPDLHDAYRVSKAGTPTYREVEAALRRFQRLGVRVNALTTVHAANASAPLRVYDHLVQLGIQFIQFIPIVERRPITTNRLQLQFAAPEDVGATVTEWSAGAEQYGDFLIAVFDRWHARDLGRVFVQMFDVALENWLGLEPSLCIFRSTCGGAVALERSGDVYSCDHYVYPAHLLGSIHDASLSELVRSQKQYDFGQAKAATLPGRCRSCDVYFACKGECPKNRFAVAENGEPGLNYLCQGYLKFFRHIGPAMRDMASTLRHGNAPVDGSFR